MSFNETMSKREMEDLKSIVDEINIQLHNDGEFDNCYLTGGVWLRGEQIEMPMRTLKEIMKHTTYTSKSRI